VNRIERLRMEERVVELSVAAILRRHPQGKWLADKGRERPIPLKDAALTAACERLEAWVAEQPPLPPPHPDSKIARKDA
jgi:hypothetical protein